MSPDTISDVIIVQMNSGKTFLDELKRYMSGHGIVDATVYTYTIIITIIITDILSL